MSTLDILDLVRMSTTNDFDDYELGGLDDDDNEMALTIFSVVSNKRFGVPKNTAMMSALLKTMYCDDRTKAKIPKGVLEYMLMFLRVV